MTNKIGVDVIGSIMGMDDAELNRVVDAVNYRRSQIAKQAAKSFKIGDEVEFDTRGGGTASGTVVKVNQKTCTVKGQGPLPLKYRVPGSMLRRV